MFPPKGVNDFKAFFEPHLSPELIPLTKITNILNIPLFYRFTKWNQKNYWKSFEHFQFPENSFSFLPTQDFWNTPAYEAEIIAPSLKPWLILCLIVTSHPAVLSAEELKSVKLIMVVKQYN